MSGTRGEPRALTPRQHEILEMVSRGISNKAIAAQLGIRIDTVRRHTSRIKQKEAVSNTSALACQHLLARLDIPYALTLPEGLLTLAETRVVTFLCHGLSSKEIARALNISSRTVDKHREHVLRKLGLRSTRQLTAWVASQYAKSGIPIPSDNS
jgi:DNA-binding CsgD family transcriptional regulator